MRPSGRLRHTGSIACWGWASCRLRWSAKCRASTACCRGVRVKWVTQADVQQQGLRGGGWCSAQPQFQMMYSFDTLIGNEGRTARSILFDSDDWFVYGTAHDHAFGTAAATCPRTSRHGHPRPARSFAVAWVCSMHPD